MHTSHSTDTSTTEAIAEQLLTTAVFEVNGKLSRGRETPRFTATLKINNKLVASFESDGHGGSVFVEWKTRSSIDERAATLWLMHEAARIWARIEGEPADEGSLKMFASPGESSLLVVEEHLNVKALATQALATLGTIAKTRRPTAAERIAARELYHQAAILGQNATVQQRLIAQHARDCEAIRAESQS